MLLAGRDQYGISRLYLLLALLVTDFAMAFKDVDLMLPIVLMKRRVTSRLYGEMSHEEIWSSIVFIDEPLYSRSLRVLFGDRRIYHRANVDFVQVESLVTRMIEKISYTLKLEKFIVNPCTSSQCL